MFILPREAYVKMLFLPSVLALLITHCEQYGWTKERIISHSSRDKASIFHYSVAGGSVEAIKFCLV